MKVWYENADKSRKQNEKWFVCMLRVAGKGPAQLLGGP